MADIYERICARTVEQHERTTVSPWRREHRHCQPGACASFRLQQVLPITRPCYLRDGSFQVIRRKRPSRINVESLSREALETRHGQVWDTVELIREFTAEALVDSCFVVRRRSDGRLGGMEYQLWPRYYFNFDPDRF